MFPDSKIAKEMHIKRTKFNDTMKMLGRAVNEDLAVKLRITKFSIIIDETTDISSMKCLAVLVMYFDTVTHSIHVRLLDVLDIYENETTGSRGENLYKLIIKCLEDHMIPIHNLLGLAADGAANIMGEHNSLCSKLRAEVPAITIFKCICHSIHLCASEAAKCLPRQCEDIIRNLH